MSPEEVFERCSLMRWRFASKPILGGALQQRGMLLAEYRHRVNMAPIYFVVDPVSLCPVAEGRTKGEALASGRDAALWPGLDDWLKRCRELAQKFDNGGWKDNGEGASARKPQKASRRRRQLFNAHGGRCIYCACELELDGVWHVEHRLPRALGGDNSPENLAPACAPCNLRKSDKTDTEFSALLQAGRAA